MIDAAFKNFSRTSRSRVMVDCGIAYESDLEMVRDLTMNTIEELFPQNSNEEVEFFYKEFGDSSINFVVRFWAPVTSKRDVLIAQSNAIIAMKKTYDSHGINIPFPIRTLEFNNRLKLDQPKGDQKSES